MFHAIVDPLDRPLEQRTTLYGRTTTVGRRLRPPPETLAPADLDPSATPVELRPRATATI
jgi:hypothetical protein